MRAKIVLASAVVFLASAALSSAADPQMGTWKLNEGKSKLNPSATKNLTVAYTAAGDSVKVTVDGVDKDGKPAHSEWTGKFDGKDYAVTGDPTADMRSYKKIDERTLEIINKKAGAVTSSGRIAVSADGKSRTLSIAATDASGQKISPPGVYDQQYSR